MKKITFILVIVSILGVGFSQNTHFTFPNGPLLTSAVTIVNNNGIAHLIQAGSDKIHISDIDPTNMQPLGNTYSYVLPNFQTVCLSGGYEDFNNNIIVYGYAPVNNDDYFLIVKIDLNSMFVSYVYGPGGKIIEGCCGKDVNGNICNLFLLSNINNSINEVIAYNDNLTPCTTQPFQSSFGTITDISWDPYHDLFIASGSTPTSRIDPFLIYFTCDVQNPSFFQLVDGIRVLNQQFFQGAEGRTLHEVIDDRHLILCHDLRDLNTDYIWTIQIDNTPLNLSVLNSKTFRLPQPILFLQDMRYDSYNKKLTILGRNVLCVDGINLIAQMDPYSLTNFKIAQIMDQYSNSICAVGPPANFIYGNEIYLQRLELNPFNSCHTILSTGINEIGPWGTSPYITETYDIALSQCDQPLPIFEYDLTTYIDYSPYLVVSQSVITSQISNAIPISSFSLLQIIECNDMVYCSKGSIKSNINTQLTKSIPKINLYSCEYFECSHFSGTIYYYLYDLTGKILFQGSTKNENKTTLPNLTNGIYILSVVDEVGTQKSVKVIYFK
jgi:hypothetical protein